MIKVIERSQGVLPRPDPARRRVGRHFLRLLPPRSMVGQLPLEQHIGVRIPGGQPKQDKLFIISNLGGAVRPANRIAEDLMVLSSLGRFERRHLLTDDFLYVPCYLW
jgi:hypothetical protein